MTTRADRDTALPPTLPPRGLSRVQASAYVGVSPVTFDKMVRDGRMPQPKKIDRRRVWDRFEVDAAFDALSDHEQNPWDEDAA